MLDYNGVVRSVKLRIGKSNRDDQNQIVKKNSTQNRFF